MGFVLALLLLIWIIGIPLALRIMLNSWRKFGRDEVPIYVRYAHDSLDAYVRSKVPLCVGMALLWPITVPLLLLSGEELPLRKPE